MRRLALEPSVGLQALEIEFLRGTKKNGAAERRAYVRSWRPLGMSVTRGCDLMGLPRSTYYDVPSVPADDTEIVLRIQAVCDEFETYGYRRVG